MSQGIPPTQPDDRQRRLQTLLYTLGGALQGQQPLTTFQELQAIQQQRQQRAQLDQAIQNLDLPEAQKNLLRSFSPQQQMNVLANQFNAPKLTSKMQEYNLAKDQGYEGTFLDYQQATQKPLVSIADKTESEFQKEATKDAFKTLEATRKTVEGFADIEGRLGIIQKQLESGNLETGFFEEIKLPFKRLAAAFNILPQDELEGLDAQELYQRTINYIIPRLRVAGSGATSDTEIRLFTEAAPSLSLTVGGNLLVVGGMSAIAKYNRERLKLMEKYIMDENLGNGDLIGFGEYADKELGSIFKTYDSDESFDQQVRNGTLKAGDFVFDGIYGDYRILTPEDVQGIK